MQNRWQKYVKPLVKICKPLRNHKVKNLAIFPLGTNSCFFEKSAPSEHLSCGQRADIVHTLWYNILIICML